MKTYELRREQWIPAPLDRVFSFFADAHNLERITPAWLGFHILTPGRIEMREGLRIDYALRLGVLPLRWRTCITEWKPGEYFVDVQEQGPYARWEHVHRFRDLGRGVHMTDVVHYALPLGRLGRLAQRPAVRPALDTIFDHREREIRRIFAPADEARRFQVS